MLYAGLNVKEYFVSAVSTPQCLGYGDTQLLLMWVLVLNSSPHACSPSVLLIEPSSQTLHLLLCEVIFLFVWLVH